MKLRPFELTLVIVFGVMALLALYVVSTWEPSPDGPEVVQVGAIKIWGTLPAEGINEILLELTKEDDVYRDVTYEYHNPDRFDNALTQALADGQGPDLLLISHEKLVTLRKRILPIQYEYMPLPDIRSLYLDGAEIFAMSDGMYGLPVAADPLVMYWNRDIMAAEGYLEAPRTWEMLVNTMFPKLIQRDFDRTIRRSVVAMGEYNNVRNAFGIISSLLLQSGSGLVIEGNDKYVIQLQSALGQEYGAFNDPLKSAADFYTRFSRPSNALYSWNRALPEDRQQFISGDLVFYYGYGSEGPQIEHLNPNLNFSIAEIPQGETATIRRTYGRFYALSIQKNSRNIDGASALMSILSAPNIADRIAIDNDMVPVHRATVAQGSNDIYGRVAYSSASVALGWLNPNLPAINGVFETMAQDINENRRTLSESVDDVTLRLRNEY